MWNPVLLSVLAAFFALLALASLVPILRHAVSRSVGTLALVLGVPGYVLVYAFGQFEHPRKHWVVPIFLGSLVLFAVLFGLR